MSVPVQLKTCTGLLENAREAVINREKMEFNFMYYLHLVVLCLMISQVVWGNSPKINYLFLEKKTNTQSNMDPMTTPVH
jgi:hypothetical protein